MESEKGFFTRQELNIKGTIENREEKIITDAEEARRQFVNFWKKNNSPRSIKEELKQNEKDRIEELMRQGDEMTTLLYHGADNEEEKPEKNKFDFNKILIASGSEEKRTLFSYMVKKQGLEIAIDLEDRENKEIKQHAFLKKSIKQDDKQENKNNGRIKDYALDVAKSKAIDGYNHYENNPVIASDIVVLEGSNILEKPKSKEDAINILSNLSGKEISVSCGVTLLTKTKSGKEILLNEGVNFNIKLRDFSFQEANEYIDRQKDSMLNIAGVIDFSNPEAQKFIDNKEAVKVEPLKLETNDGKVISISSQVLPDLRDYFKGAPKELIEEMLGRQKALSGV